MYKQEKLNDLRKYLDLDDNPMLHSDSVHMLNMAAKYHRCVKVKDNTGLCRLLMTDFMPFSEFRISEANLVLMESTLDWQRQIRHINVLLYIIVHLDAKDTHILEKARKEMLDFRVRSIMIRRDMKQRSIFNIKRHKMKVPVREMSTGSFIDG